MMQRMLMGIPLVLALVGLCGAEAGALELEMQAVQFPERDQIKLDLVPRPGAPAAKMKAEILYRDGQARVELSYDDMKPAVLFGGDVTCYVLWAVREDGRWDNLGEVIVEDDDATLEFSTANKQFALLVTAEPYYLVPAPSALPVFINAPSRSKKAATRAFTFAGFAPAPKHAIASITDVRRDSDTPLVLVQAHKAYELAGRRGAAIHAARLHRDAGLALSKADESASRGKDTALLDHGRRAIALSNEAINITMNRLESIAIEENLAKRRAELKALEERVAEAQSRAREAEDAARRLRAEKEAVTREKVELTAAVGDLRQDMSRLNERLEGALSKIAETTSGAKGFVVSLPDVLFDVNEANLKPEARLVLAELAGVLHVMPELGVAVEGHTDSTGSPDYNLRLSERRAESVRAFLGSRDVPIDRLRAVGYGMTRPVADNDTPEGRKRNRRVEIVISGAASQGS